MSELRLVSDIGTLRLCDTSEQRAHCERGASDAAHQTKSDTHGLAARSLSSSPLPDVSTGLQPLHCD